LGGNVQRAGKLAFIDDQGTLSYGQLEERVRRVAGSARARVKRRNVSCC